MKKWIKAKGRNSHYNKKYHSKKYISIILIAALLVSFLTTISFADNEESEEEENTLYQNILQELQNEKNVISASNKLDKPTINSRRYVVYDRSSKTVIYGKDENKQTAMASTTKIMTSLVILDKCSNLNEVVTISEKAANTGGSTLGINTGDKITVMDLLYGLMLRSGNDTAVALAEYVGGSIEEFAKMMNEKAEKLGLKNTNFVTPHGLDNTNHYTTAYELAYLTDFALKNETFSKIVKTQYATISINGNPREIKNTNELLLANTEGVYGVKTGFTNNAGRCLVTAVKRNDMDLIVVVLGADTKKDRAKDSLKLIEYAYNRFKMQDIESFAQKEFEMWKNINQNRIYINKARVNLELALQESEIKSIATDQELTAEINCLNYLEAPVEKGTKVGSMIIKNGDNIIEELDIVLAKTVERRNILDYFYIFAKITIL